RARTVLALAHVLDFLAHELASLSRWRLALALVLPCPFQGFSIRHVGLQSEGRFRVDHGQPGSVQGETSTDRSSLAKTRTHKYPIGLPMVSSAAPRAAPPLYGLPRSACLAWGKVSACNATLPHRRARIVAARGRTIVAERASINLHRRG